MELSRVPSPVAEEVTDCRPAANSSAKWARDCLNPVVLTLAILLDVTLRSELAALSPDSAIWNGIVALLQEISSARLSDIAPIPATLTEIPPPGPFNDTLSTRPQTSGSAACVSRPTR